jgi:hypothetical protein
MYCAAREAHARVCTVSGWTLGPVQGGGEGESEGEGEGWSEDESEGEGEGWRRSWSWSRDWNRSAVLSPGEALIHQPDPRRDAAGQVSGMAREEGGMLLQAFNVGATGAAQHSDPAIPLAYPILLKARAEFSRGETGRVKSRRAETRRDEARRGETNRFKSNQAESSRVQSSRAESSQVIPTSTLTPIGSTTSSCGSKSPRRWSGGTPRYSPSHGTRNRRTTRYGRASRRAQRRLRRRR